MPVGRMSETIEKIIKPMLPSLADGNFALQLT
jgi:hypothetical protein